MPAPELVPPDFEVPEALTCRDFHLTPLGPEHNDADYAAWMSSIEHIRATPGFADWSWPVPMTPEENLRDLREHRDDFVRRRGFTYTVLDPSDAVIGCVYIYPSKRPGVDAAVRSWVRADCAHLDLPLYDAVSTWLAKDWPFATVDYAGRNG